MCPPPRSLGWLGVRWGAVTALCLGLAQEIGWTGFHLLFPESLGISKELQRLRSRGWVCSWSLEEGEWGRAPPHHRMACSAPL